MNHHKEYRTFWSKESPPYGAFDDYVIFESLDRSYKFLIRPEEFNFIMGKIWDLWRAGATGYFEILKDWNESTGFNDIEELPSIIHEIQEFINALMLVKGVNQPEFAQATIEDIQELIKFLNTHRDKGILIRKEF